MPAALTLRASSVDELDDFARALEAIGVQAWRFTIGAARTLRHRVDQSGGWERVELDTQPEWMRRARPVVSWLLVTGRLTPSADFLAQADLRLGGTARRHLPEVHAWFTTATDEDTALQWNALCKVAALSGTRPDEIDTDRFRAARGQLYSAYTRRGKPEADRNVRAIFHRLQLTLFTSRIQCDPRR